MRPDPLALRWQCADCPQQYATEMALYVHRYYKHGGRS